MSDATSSWTDHFPGNFLWSNPMLVCKGMAPYGAVALDELDRIGAALAGASPGASAWADAWTAMGAQVERRGDEAHARGREHTAGDYWLRAGFYLYTGERFVPPGPEKRALAERAFLNLRRGLARRHPNVERVELPYAGTTLPALFMRAPVTGPAPTVVVFNGMDNIKEMSVLFAGLEFARRGMHTLCVDGPGMGETQRLRGIPARFDYEVPAAAAVDWLAWRRDRVDLRRLVIMGYSFGGYYATRIAAHEPRFAAMVALTAPHWDLAGFQQAVLERQRAAQGASVAQSNFQFPWVMGARDADHAIEIARGFDVASVAPRVRCPALVTHGAHDRVIPVANAQKLFDALGSERKHLKIFTREEGGCEHAHVDNRQVGIDYAADWIAETLA
jgi:dienelactone hydrolase